MILNRSLNLSEQLRHQARGRGGDILVLPLSTLWATFGVDWRLRGREAIWKCGLSDVLMSFLPSSLRITSSSFFDNELGLIRITVLEEPPAILNISSLRF